jgi:hypothetical protein
MTVHLHDDEKHDGITFVVAAWAHTTFFFASFNGVNHEVFLFEKGDPIRTVCFAIYICVSIRSRSSWDPAGSAESKFIETGCD